MDNITLIVSDEEITGALNALVARVSDASPAFDAIGNLLASNARLAIIDSRTPYGESFAPLALSTRLARGRRAGGGSLYTKSGKSTNRRAYEAIFSAKPLLDTGALLNSIQSSDARPDSVTFGTNRPYAAALQFGAKKGEFGRTSRGGPIPWGDIPARPYFPIRNGEVDLPRDQTDEVLDILSRFFGGAS